MLPLQYIKLKNKYELNHNWLTNRVYIVVKVLYNFVHGRCYFECLIGYRNVYDSNKGNLSIEMSPDVK